MDVADAAPVVGSASLHRATGEVIVKLVDPSREARSIALRVAGLANAREVRVTTLGADPEVENTLEEPTAVAPRSSTTTITGGVVEYALGAHTLAVLRVR